MKKFGLLLIITIVLVVFVVINQKPTYIIVVGNTQGTTYKISYKLDKGNKNLKPEIDKLLHRFDLSLSTYNDSSIISAVNRNEQNVELDAHFMACYKEAKNVWKASNGMFDITIGPLASAYGFGPGKRIDLTPETIDSLLNFVGMEKTAINEKRFIKENSKIKLNVNAIAQGYAVDVVCDFLDSLQSENYMVEIGGEVRIKGLNKEGAKWRIGVDKPIEGNMAGGQNLQQILSLEQGSVATSGNYRKFYEKDGKKYTHTINPKTGHTVQSNLLSATIITEKCMRADAFATACMASGLEQSKIMIEENNLDAYLIYSDSLGNMQVFQTANLEKWKDEKFQD